MMGVEFDITATWPQALANYATLRNLSDGLPDGHPDEDEAVDRYCEAMDHLVEKVRAPDAEALTLKIELARQRWDGFGIPDDWLDAIVADVRELVPGAAPA